MNTKLLLSSITLALLLFQNNSMGASHQKHSLAFETKTNSKTPPGNNNSKDVPLDWTFNWHDVFHAMGHQADHEDKTHKFHFYRFTKNRNRILLIIMIKFLLLITHVSTFLCAAIHFLH